MGGMQELHNNKVKGKNVDLKLHRSKELKNALEEKLPIFLI